MARKRTEKTPPARGPHPNRKLREELESLSLPLQPELPLGRHILLVAKSVWVRYPSHWWRINLVAHGEYREHPHPFGIPITRAYLIHRLALVQEAATSVLCRGAELFGIDHRPILLSGALCQTHFNAVDPMISRPLADDDAWWPHCLKRTPTTLSIEQQREAYDGERLLSRLISMAHRESEERFLCSNGVLASRFVLPLVSTANNSFDRIEFEDLTLTIRLDNEAFVLSSNPKAFKIFKLLWEHSGEKISGAVIRSSIPGLKATNAISEALGRVPSKLRKCIQSDTRGYWLVLPKK